MVIRKHSLNGNRKDIKFIEDIVIVATFSFSESDTHIENILKANRLLFWNAFVGVGIINELKVLNPAKN
jgi:hypothetical protein